MVAVVLPFAVEAEVDAGAGELQDVRGGGELVGDGEDAGARARAGWGEGDLEVQAVAAASVVPQVLLAGTMVKSPGEGEVSERGMG